MLTRPGQLTAGRRPAFGWAFAILWWGLATAQSYRALTACGSPSGWAAALWLLHGAALIAPLYAIRHALADQHRVPSRPFDVALGLTLLTYLPLTVAMRLFELCVAQR